MISAPKQVLDKSGLQVPGNQEVSPSPHLVLSHWTSISIETRVEMRAVAMSQPVGGFIPANV